MRFFSKKYIAKSLYRGILRRNSTISEIKQRSTVLQINPKLDAHIEDMIKSSEFSTSVLPYLIAKKYRAQKDQKVFFLHVPKTAGTSIRIALTEILGIASLNLYFNSMNVKKHEFEHMHFWPYWAGHANISIFPKDFIGFTTFRDTKSRLITT